MASTEDILNAAKELGKLIEKHDISEKLSSSALSLEKDTTAQRAAADFARTMSMVEAKAAQGLPIEVSDKQSLEEARIAVATNPILAQFQQAQFEMFDLLRKIDEAMLENSPLNQSRQPISAEPESTGNISGAGPILSV